MLVAACALPLAAWLCRNKALSGEWTGPRLPSDAGLGTNLRLFYEVVSQWVVPGDIQALPWFVSAAPFVAMLVILGYLFARTLVTPRFSKNNLYLNVLAPPSDNFFTQVNDLLLKHVESVDLRRLDRSASTLQATYLIACPSDQVLVSLMDDMSTQLPGCEFSFVEQDNTLGG